MEILVHSDQKVTQGAQGAQGLQGHLLVVVVVLQTF